MSNKKSQIQNIYKFLLLFGLICVSLGIIIQICIFNKTKFNAVVIQAIVITLIGESFLYIAFVHSPKFRFYFPGLLLSQVGIYWLIINTVITSLYFIELWPVLLIIIGESVLLGSLIPNKKISLYVFIPSISFILLGIVFLIFSLDIIKISFIAFATTWWPIMLILAGIVLLIIYFYKQTDKQDTEAVINGDEET